MTPHADIANNLVLVCRVDADCEPVSWHHGDLLHGDRLAVNYEYQYSGNNFQLKLYPHSMLHAHYYVLAHCMTM